MGKAQCAAFTSNLSRDIVIAKVRLMKNTENLHTGGRNFYSRYHNTAMLWYYGDKYGLVTDNELTADKQSMLDCWGEVYTISKFQSIGGVGLNAIVIAASFPSGRTIVNTCNRSAQGIDGASLMDGSIAGVKRLQLWSSRMGSFRHVSFPQFIPAEVAISRVIANRNDYSPMFSDVADLGYVKTFNPPASIGKALGVAEIYRQVMLSSMPHEARSVNSSARALGARKYVGNVDEPDAFFNPIQNVANSLPSETRALLVSVVFGSLTRKTRNAIKDITE